MREPGAAVQVRFTKWDGSPHWTFPTTVLGADEHGVWLGMRPGDEMRKGADAPKEFTVPGVKVITPGLRWSAVFHRGRHYDLFVDVVTPAEWRDGDVHMVDIDLDVVRHAVGTVEVVDEDEFREHQAAMHYPPQLVDVSRAVTAELALAVERGDEPFATVGYRWLDRWIVSLDGLC